MPIASTFGLDNGTYEMRGGDFCFLEELCPASTEASPDHNALLSSFLLLLALTIRVTLHTDSRSRQLSCSFMAHSICHLMSCNAILPA